MLSTDRFAIRFDVLSEAQRSTSKLGMMIIVTAEMSPRHDVIGSNNGKRPSQPDKKMRNILDATQALELWQNVLWKHWSTFKESLLQVEAKVALSRSSMSILSLCLRGT
jgi:hypothetical protein